MRREHFDGDEQQPGSRPAPPPRSPLACAAEPCRWIGTSGDKDRFFCIAHSGRDSSEWTAITDRTQELQWFADFIADVQRKSTFPRKGHPSWADFADGFWRESDPTMQPSPDERGNPGLYGYRMLGELRAMALGTDRPKPHVPQGRQPEWQARKARAETTPGGASAPTPDANARAFAGPARPVAPPTTPDLADVPAWVIEDEQEARA